MKEFSGQKDYWKDKTYFSMDGFFSEEQSTELREMFREIKLKAKFFDNENAKKKSVKGLRFRRFKFYDMFFSSIFVLLSMLLVNASAFALEAIVQVPLEDTTFQLQQRFEPKYQFSVGGGNDPTGDTIDNEFDFLEPIDLSRSDYYSNPEKPYVFVDRDQRCSLMVGGSIYSAGSELCSIKKSVVELQMQRKGSRGYDQLYYRLVQQLNEYDGYR